MNRMLPVGAATRNWALAEPGKQRIAVSDRAMLKWQAFWFERNWRTQVQLLRSRPDIVDPVFIVGLWRSGTTYLHDLLALHPDLRAPQTWECMAPSTFLLTGTPAASKVARRPMDHHVIHAQSPQEDEFALLALGGPTHYRGFLRPDRIAETIPLFSQQYWLDIAEAGEWCGRWLEFLRMLEIAPRQRLLLKSPNHLFRLAALAERFPRARFIYIGREPLDCLRSNQKMWRTMCSTYGLTPVSAGDLERFLMAAAGGAKEALVWAKKHLAPENFLTLDLSDLDQDPASALHRIGNFLQLQGQQEWLSKAIIAAAQGRPRQPEASSIESSPADSLANAFMELGAFQSAFG